MLPADEDLRGVQRVAVAEARRQMDLRGVHRGYLHPEHLAVGLLADPHIAEVFRAHGALEELERVIRIGLNRRWRDPPGTDPTGWEVHHSLEVAVLEGIAAAEAKRLRHARVSPTHLALAFVLSEETLIAHALIDLGVEETVQAELLAKLVAAPVPSNPESSTERLARVRAQVLAANGDI